MALEIVPGVKILSIEIDETKFADWLVSTKRLRDWETDCDAKVAEAAGLVLIAAKKSLSRVTGSI